VYTYEKLKRADIHSNMRGDTPSIAITWPEEFLSTVMATGNYVGFENELQIFLIRIICKYFSYA
jgi:hypothetical protein